MNRISNYMMNTMSNMWVMTSKFTKILGRKLSSIKSIIESINIEGTLNNDDRSSIRRFWV